MSMSPAKSPPTAACPAAANRVAHATAMSSANLLRVTGIIAMTNIAYRAFWQQRCAAPSARGLPADVVQTSPPRPEGSPQLPLVNVGKPGRAMLWIEAQSTPVIPLLVFGSCYMLTAAIFCLAAILSRRAVAQDLKAVVPVTLTPLGVILGLVIVFLASRVWMNLDRAGEYVGQEAGALRETVLL